ncbi:MAG TPA: hypothetical protein ENK23_00480, partial [Sorangium sp.]|nr:hypothetical protein [Sorangium sp.]
MSIAARRQARRNPAVPAPPWRARPHRHRGVAGGGRRGGGAALVAVCAALWLCAGCGDDAFDLGKTSATSGSGAGGAGGGSVAVSSGSGAGGAGGSPIVEPPGATTFTLVQGIVDRPSLRFCLIPYPAGPHDEQPWPGVGGLSFGSAHVETDISQLISDGSDMQLWGIAGDLTATGAKNCATLLQQTPANVTTWSFGVLPASVFQQDKDLLLVTNGCLGGDGHTDEQQTSYCGAGYSPQTPNATVTAGFMSRLMTTGKISLQFVHATQAAVPMRLRVRAGNDTAVALTVEKNWGWGSYAPYPPFATFS